MNSGRGGFVLTTDTFFFAVFCGGCGTIVCGWSLAVLLAFAVLASSSSLAMVELLCRCEEERCLPAFQRLGEFIAADWFRQQFH